VKQILLIEDETNLLDSLSGFLRYEGYDLIVAASMAQGRVAQERRPDLILLDWRLPDGQGLELLKEWRQRGIDTPVILLTARADLLDKILALENGANDYLTKPFEPRELLARIRVQLRSRPCAPGGPDSAWLKIAGIAMNTLTREVFFGGRRVELKKMEFALLRLFLESPEQVFSRDEILNKVWGYDSYPTTRTIDTHILQLRQKFSSDLFETVRGIGYRFHQAQILTN
jgi:DNA-binding response OmpR family regulator